MKYLCVLLAFALVAPQARADRFLLFGGNPPAASESYCFFGSTPRTLPEPTPVSTAPAGRPAGDGWQWDEAGKYWWRWKYVTPTPTPARRVTPVWSYSQPVQSSGFYQPARASYPSFGGFGGYHGGSSYGGSYGGGYSGGGGSGNC